MKLCKCNYFAKKIQIKFDHEDHFFDFVIFLGYFSFFVFAIIIRIFFEPTMENTSGRLILQVTFVDLFLIRLLWKCHKSRNFPQKMPKKCSSIVDPQNILILPVTILNVRNLDSTGKKDDKFSGIIFG